MTTTEKLSSVIVTSIKAAFRPRDARLDALEADIKELKARPSAKDAGVWTHGVTYNPGDIVSHAGSGWICRSAHYSVGSEPDHAYFRLFVKRGKDAR